MALIECIDCQNNISDSAPTCIHCGRINHKTNKHHQETITIQKTSRSLKGWKSVFQGLLLIGLAMAFLGWGIISSWVMGIGILGWASVNHIIYYNHK